MILTFSNRIQVVRLLAVLIALGVISLSARGQDVSQYDHGTPPQHAAGVSSIGSYISADLGTVNLSNGSLNFKLPLGTVGGRGFWLPLTLNYTGKVWSARTGSDFVSDPTPHREPVAVAVYDDPAQAEDIYYKLGPGWTAGAAPYIRVRGVGVNPHNNPTTGCTDFTWVLVKLTVVLPDKGEIELRDDQTDGAPMSAQTFSSGCRTQDGYRGRRWHATDGSGACFINDIDNGVVNGDVAGRFFTADGTVYRFANANFGNSAGTAYLKNLGRCTSVTDRNGNYIQIAYPTNTRVQYTDQLGRVTTLDINDPSLAPYVLQVTLPGYNGQNRVYKVKQESMNLHYRAGINPALPVINGDDDPLGYGYGWPGNPTRLFPLSYGSGAMRIDNYSVVTQLVLPDNRVLSFNYNEFGEVAEVQMPTGGKVQYDHQSVLSDSQAGTGLPAGNSLPCEVHPVAQQLGSNVASIDRAVVAMRTYPDGSTLEGNWSYGFKVDKTEVQCRNISNTLLLDQLHYYLSSQRFLVCTNGAPDGTGYSIWSTGLEFRNERRDSNQTTVMAASQQDWTQRANVSWSTGYTAQQIANDNRVNEERKYLDDGSFSRVHTTYDPTIAASNHINNPSEVDEYDFDGSLKRYSTASYLIGGHYTGTGTNTVNLLSLPTQQSVFEGGVELARTAYEYDSYLNDGNRASLVDHGSVAGHDSGFGTGFMERGNPTQISRMINGTAFIYTYPRYDTLGNVISTKDPRGNVTTVDYLDDFGDGSNPGFNTGGHNTYSLATKITSPPPNQGESPHVAYSQYDYNTGLLTGFKDRNGVITQTIYNDAFDRPTQVKAALGTSLENHTAIYYAPTSVSGVSLTNNDVLTAKDQVSFDSNLRGWTHTDGFGRTIESWTSDPQGDVKVTAVYDGLGRAVQTSNPFRPSVPETQYNTTTAYDLLGRVKTVTTADNAVVATLYSGARVLVTDQAGKQRISQRDGLGRLTDVWEVTPADTATESVTFPGSSVTAGYRTIYGYDALDDLTVVTQKLGTTPKQTRTFSYDALKRLTQAINPESGTVNYTYDANSNLATKQDVRSITTTYGYDNLNRVISRTYSGSTPTVSYKYDGQTLPTGAPTFTRGSSTGRLVAVTYGTGSAGNYTGYDQLGRANVSYQQTDSNNYSFGYSYNLASEMTSETYPSGRVVQTEFDSAGRVAGVRNQSANWYYAGAAATDTTNRIQYASHGAISAMKLGNGKWEHTTYDPKRLQPTLIGLGTSASDSSVLKLDYTYNTTGQTNNNGNVLSQTITIGTTVMTQSYGYDALNRLSSASETGAASWSQNYGYDRFGNRWFSSGSYLPNPTLTPQSVAAYGDQSNNRLSASQYDNAGNQTTDAATGGFTYDAENRQISSNVGGTYVTYSYDGDGRRVKKVVGASTTIFVYNAGGQLIAEYTSPDTVSNNGLSYLTSDHLGSTRVVTDINGFVKSRHDYLPFGEEIGTDHCPTGLSYGAMDGEHQKFTSKERDSESGLDYFLARYYSSAQGRFTSPDELAGGPLELGAGEDNARRPLAYADILAPQSLNKYHYCLNNPLHYVDPDGHDWRIAEENDGNGKLVRRYVWDRNYTWKDGDKNGAPAYFRYLDTQGRVIQLWGDSRKDPSKDLDHNYSVVTEDGKFKAQNGEPTTSYATIADTEKLLESLGFKQAHLDFHPAHLGSDQYMKPQGPTFHISLFGEIRLIKHIWEGGQETYTGQWMLRKADIHIDRYSQTGSGKELERHFFREFLGIKWR